MAAAGQVAKQKRSTQSFVGVMASVWKRPSLVALEVAWRWIAGGPIMLVVYLFGKQHSDVLAEVWAQWGTMTFFHPAEMASTLGATSARLFDLAQPVLAKFITVSMLWWCAVGAIGQVLFAKRLLGAASKTRLALVFCLRLMRSLGVLLCWALWASVVLAVAHHELTTKATLGAEPDVLVFLAVSIVFSLALFVGWATLSWPLSLALAWNAQHGTSLGGSLRASVTSKLARSEVLEISLVMCIVKIALVVLAMTFSACPLPFATIATQEFLQNWWIAMAVLYMLASDYFHSVRFAAYVQVCEAALDETA
ncbi:MAG: hypothetical protein PW792_14305 [Acidobacteriaceae bacterium]|nr:hypothetical protein [Acidobacteriaceae bacterium]